MKTLYFLLFTFYFTSLHFTSLHFTLLYFILFYFTLLYLTLPYLTLLDFFTSLHFTSLHFTSLYFTLLYFTAANFSLLYAPCIPACVRFLVSCRTNTADRRFNSFVFCQNRTSEFRISTTIFEISVQELRMRKFKTCRSIVYEVMLRCRA